MHYDTVGSLKFSFSNLFTHTHTRARIHTVWQLSVRNCIHASTQWWLADSCCSGDIS